MIYQLFVRRHPKSHAGYNGRDLEFTESVDFGGTDGCTRPQPDFPTINEFRFGEIFTMID